LMTAVRNAIAAALPEQMKPPGSAT
jgi:hypothetical protein